MFKGFVREGELRRWAPWAGAVLLILMAVVLETSMESVCWDNDVAKAAKINEAAGCFEFWFNRYQTLVGAIVAVAAAGVAWIGVSRQIDKADEQITIAARQSAIAILPILDDRTRNAINLHGRAVTIHQHGTKSRSKAQIALKKAEDLRLAYASASDVDRVIDVFDASVENYKRELDTLSGALDLFFEEWNSSLATPDLRQACQDYWFLFYLSFRRNRFVLSALDKCTGKKFRNEDDVEACFSVLGSIDIATLGVPPEKFIIPLNEIGRHVSLLQAERDGVFDRSRA